MKVLIIGGVAAGTKAAAKLKREMASAEVTIVTKSAGVSYAGCGLPYYIGGLIEEKSELIGNTPESFEGLTGAKVLTKREVYAVNTAEKKVQAKNLSDGSEETYTYDKLIIASGASPVVPKLDGIDKKGIFTLREPDDAEAIRKYAEENSVKRAVVVGAGFIGLEVAENLKAKGISVTVIDVMSQVLPAVLDSDMADYVKRKLQAGDIRIMTGTKVEGFQGNESVTAVMTDHGRAAADMVVLSVGIRPNTTFLADTDIEMFKGTIITDSCMRTNVEDVYAAGDCCMVTSRVTGRPQWSPMGSSANYEGRVLAKSAAGKEASYPGVLHTAVVKLNGFSVGRTGLTVEQAKQAGYEDISVLVVTDDKAHYYPDSDTFIIRLVADVQSRRLLGLQVIGAGAVDKITDTAAVAIAMKAVLSDLESLDLAYAPPFSTAVSPFVQAVYALENKLDGTMVSMTPYEYAAGKADGYRLIDAAKGKGIPGAEHVELTQLTGPIPGIEKDEKLLLVCAKGKRAYFLQRKLMSYGYTNTVVLEGSTFFNEVRAAGPKAAVSAEEITRVKALGCLFDKQTTDCFNVRVITRNGKITAEEMQAVTEAAAMYGNGEIAMTTRLTIEIQHVPYDNIEPLRAYLANAGLETGGTGSKVRPVVSCKGTTCQYGLIDTFRLSQEIHERFYVGYHDVKLPHKFKIAVGGCPNNCVKPDLNDLGIVGQRIPEAETDKCRGCRTCQVVNTCPINAASMVDGKLVIDQEKCNHCGRCVGKCPFKAVSKSTFGYRIYVGGRWGKNVAKGRYLDRIFTSEQEVLDMVEKAILFFRDKGVTGERFSDTIDRIGFENVQEELFSDDLLKNKAANLAASKHLKGGATC